MRFLVKPRQLFRFFLLFAPIIADPGFALAEYRAYSLVITNIQTSSARLVISTLDDIQYPGYYPLRRYETISIQSTWMCWGRTGDFKPICPNPRPAVSPKN
jgi:hypothetical protein